MKEVIKLLVVQLEEYTKKKEDNLNEKHDLNKKIFRLNEEIAVFKINNLDSKNCRTL